MELGGPFEETPHLLPVMAGLVPAIHVFCKTRKQDVDGRVPSPPTAFVRRRTSAVKRLRRATSTLGRRSLSEGGKPGHDDGESSAAPHRRHQHLVAAAGAAVDFLAGAELQV